MSALDCKDSSTETVTDTTNRISRGLQLEDSKSADQDAFDKVQRISDHEAISSMAGRIVNPVCSPAYRSPRFDPGKRADQLQKMLDDQKLEIGQKANIDLAITMYRTGKLDGSQETFFQDGKVTDIDSIHGKSPWWSEGVGFQLGH